MQPATPTWTVRPPAAPEELARFAPLPPLAAQVFLNRGLRDAAEATDFLNPDYRRLADPMQMKGMDVATARIAHALASGERITIYGDFDADGVTSATLLVQALRHVGGQAEGYIPHRVEEGYGLNREAVESLAGEGTRLLITVDCGISNAAEIARANELGVDVIVTDHHLPPPELPPALAILNPRQADCGYPFKRLAGVGIAFTLVRGLAKAGVALQNAAGQGLRGRDLLDLVALGTVADVAALVGENRILVACGLDVLRQTGRPGLRALMDAADVRPERVNTGTIGFTLGPRLNAAGRLRHAISAYRLLLTESEEEARTLARELDTLNRERQEVTEATLERARERVLALPDTRKVIVLADAGFPAGVVGLVAGKLVEEFYRPALLIELGEQESRGSARSIGAFHITEALRACGDLLTRFGGHRVAAGFSLRNENLAALEARLEALADEQLDAAALTPSLTIDAAAGLADLNWDLVRTLEKMAPFGIENPQAVFLCPGVKVLRARRIGSEGQHLRLTVGDGRLAQDAVAWRMGEREAECRVGRYVDLACTLDTNTWNGRERLELVVRDVRPTG
jgi:single-stranded-DNA-specific exonuclease